MTWNVAFFPPHEAALTKVHSYRSGNEESNVDDAHAEPLGRCKNWIRKKNSSWGWARAEKSWVRKSHEAAGPAEERIFITRERCLHNKWRHSDFRMKCMTWFDSPKETMIDSKTEWKQCFGKINLVGHERFTGAAEGSGAEWRPGNQVRPSSSHLVRKQWGLAAVRGVSVKMARNEGSWGVLTGEGDQNFATLKLPFWDIDVKLFIKKQDSKRTLDILPASLLKRFR